MPEVFREVDIAVFPNRCEGGTNLFAMEALSSGLICAISSNTGHLDIIKNNNCLPLMSQSQVKMADRTQDWGESSVDEILAMLESTYENKDILNRINIRNSVSQLSWKNSIENLLTTLARY